MYLRLYDMATADACLCVNYLKSSEKSIYQPEEKKKRKCEHKKKKIHRAKERNG